MAEVPEQSRDAAACRQGVDGGLKGGEETRVGHRRGVWPLRPEGRVTRPVFETRKDQDYLFSVGLLQRWPKGEEVSTEAR